MSHCDSRTALTSGTDLRGRSSMHMGTCVVLREKGGGLSDGVGERHRNYRQSRYLCRAKGRDQTHLDRAVDCGAFRQDGLCLSSTVRTFSGQGNSCAGRSDCILFPRREEAGIHTSTCTRSIPCMASIVVQTQHIQPNHQPTSRRLACRYALQDRLSGSRPVYANQALFSQQSYAHF